LCGYQSIGIKYFKRPVRGGLKNIIYKIGYDYDIEIVELEAPVDHIHMVVRAEPKISPSKIMKIVKSISAEIVFPYAPRYKKEILLGWKALDAKLFCRNN
jgi:putative transposase